MRGKRAADPKNVRDSLLEAGHTPEEVEAMLGALEPIMVAVMAADRAGSGIVRSPPRNEGNNWWSVELIGIGEPPDWVPQPSLYVRGGAPLLMTMSPVRDGL
jgi:hypothetical protein